MSSPKRTKAQRQDDLGLISSLYIRGNSYRDIARIVSKQREYTLSHVTIANDVKLLLDTWKAERIDDMSGQVAEHAARFHEIERAAWRDYEKAKMSERPRFLRIAIDAVTRRAELMGLTDLAMINHIDTIEQRLEKLSNAT